MHLLKYFDKLSLNPTNASALRGLVLDLAIRGRLTEEWRRDNSDKIDRGPIINDIKGPFQLPVGWSWKILDSLSSINGGFAFKSSKYKDRGVRVIRISDFNEYGFKQDKIKRYEYSPVLDKYKLEVNNI